MQSQRYDKKQYRRVFAIDFVTKMLFLPIKPNKRSVADGIFHTKVIYLHIDLLSARTTLTIETR